MNQGVSAFYSKAINTVRGRMYCMQKIREGCHMVKREFYTTELNETFRVWSWEKRSPQKAGAKGQRDNRTRKKGRGCWHPGPADMERQLVLMARWEEGLQEMTQSEGRHVQTREKCRKRPQKMNSKIQFKTDHQGVFKNWESLINVFVFLRTIGEVCRSVKKVEKASDTNSHRASQRAVTKESTVCSCLEQKPVPTGGCVERGRGRVSPLLLESCSWPTVNEEAFRKQNAFENYRHKSSSKTILWAEITAAWKWCLVESLTFNSCTCTTLTPGLTFFLF